VRHRAALVGLLLAPAALAAQADTTRWAVRLRSPAGVEHGDLRLTPTGGRLLLESRDSAFLPITQLQRIGEQLRFGVPAAGATIQVVIDAGGRTMHGLATDRDGGVREWHAERIAPGIVQWPVRPRVRARQLAVGSGANATLIPATWVSALPSAPLLASEHAALVRASALPAVAPYELPTRSRAMVLGADPSTRGAVQRILERIAASPAADTAFRRIFIGPNGVLLDVHDRARVMAGRLDRGFQWSAAVRGLVALHRLDSALVAAEPAAQDAALSLWPQWFAGDSVLLHDIAALRTRDGAGMRALNALLEGYSSAVPWWREAVQWLLAHRWMDTPTGARSPAELMATFWGRDSVTLPTLLVERLGGFEATPEVAASRITPRLFEPRNASAAEWLTAGRTEALDAWRQIAWDDSLTLEHSAFPVLLLPPSSVTGRSAVRGVLAERDGLRIDPGIMPLLAVATVIHEWHHVLATAARLEGRGDGVRLGAGVLRLRDDDPWLAEGFAEWATEETLRPVRASLPLLSLVDHEKRMALFGGMSDDPHALGYRLVRAAVLRLPRATRRDAVVARLHDAGALARLAGFQDAGRKPPMVLRRPATAAVVPEITFTWDAGVADLVTRRLLLPPFPPER
jgi:hypothetical protein